MSSTALDATAFRALATLTTGGRISLTALDLDTEHPLPFARYETLGAYLGAMNRACSWWVGDWLLYGEAMYGDRFAQAEKATGLTEETLLRRMRVCRGVPPSRRRAALSFSVHSEVAALPADAQTRWLNRAEKAGWTLADMRAAMREERRLNSEPAAELPDPREPLPPEAVLQAARRVVAEGRSYGDDGWLVSREAMAQLAAAVGRER